MVSDSWRLIYGSVSPGRRSVQLLPRSIIWIVNQRQSSLTLYFAYICLHYTVTRATSESNISSTVLRKLSNWLSSFSSWDVLIIPRYTLDFMITYVQTNVEARSSFTIFFTNRQFAGITAREPTFWSMPWSFRVLSYDLHTCLAYVATNCCISFRSI